MEKLPAIGGGDLAVRPRDGHIFLAVPSEETIIETDRFGKFQRALTVPPGVQGLAYDDERDELVMVSNAGANMLRIDRAGQSRPVSPLSHAVTSDTLGYDSIRRELYAPLFRAKQLGVFDERGQLVRTLPTPIEPALLDVGPRSFLRMF